MTKLNRHLETVQDWLRANKISGWLLCDFRGSNPFAAQVLGLGGGIFTRRFFAWIPAKGEPKVLVHAIETSSFETLGLELIRYNGRESLLAGLKKLLGKAKTIAVEFSEHNNIPYLAKVDAGTVDLLRSMGLEVVGSGDLLQTLLVWTPSQLRNHRKAAKALAATKEAAFALLNERISQNQPITEYELQQFMLQQIQQNGMETDHAPTVGFGKNVVVGHYSPSPKKPYPLKPGPVHLDLWCKVPGDNPYADIAWMAFWGMPTPAFERAFAAILGARDLGLEFLQSRFSSGQAVRGYEVDRAVRKALGEAGYPNIMPNRCGHSLGINAVHGDVAHFDDFETFDDRLVLPGLGFTIEPSIRQGEVGVHTEINLYTHSNRVEVTTVVQDKLVRLGLR